MEEFFCTQCGVGYDQLFTTERIGVPTVNIQTEFRAPILYGDEIDAEVFALVQAKLQRYSNTV
jgi:acyl-CoA thioesterase FadM